MPESEIPSDPLEAEGTSPLAWLWNNYEGLEAGAWDAKLTPVHDCSETTHGTPQPGQG